MKIITQEEIREWAALIGPGDLIAIDEIISDENPDKKNDYILQSKHEGGLQKKIKGWLFIGKVQNLYAPSSNRRTIPISESVFHFPNPVYESIRIVLKQTGERVLKPFRKVGKIVLNRK